MEEVISSVTSSEDNGKSGLWEAESDCQRERDTHRGWGLFSGSIRWVTERSDSAEPAAFEADSLQVRIRRNLTIRMLLLKQTCNQEQLLSHTVSIHGRPRWRHIPIRKRRQPQQARTETSPTAHKITFLTMKPLRLRVSQFSQAHLIPPTTAHIQSDPRSPAPQDPLPSHQA